LSVLAQFAQNQYAYGQQIGVADPLIYAYQALGVALASTGPPRRSRSSMGSTGLPHLCAKRRACCRVPDWETDSTGIG
jgi:hypothetical protein